MFKNRSVLLTPVKTNDYSANGSTPNSDQPERDPYENVRVVEAYSEIAKDFITHAALTIGGVMAGVAIIRRICK